jgi:ketosteroid isomerase-like protein
MSTDALREQIRAQVRTALGTGRAKDDPASVAALMRRFEQGYEMVSAEAIVACFAPDVVWILPDSRVLHGREACVAFLKERFASPTGPKFSDSHMKVLGQTVVQTYKVSVPLPGGQIGTYDGTDVYQIRNGLIAHKDAYWKQVGMPKAAPTPASEASVAALMRRFEDGWVNLNPEAIVACFTPNVVWTLPDSRVLKGREACQAFLKERFASPGGPQFADSIMNVLGQTVVQTYKVSVPLPGGQTGTYDGTDVYAIQDGLIASKDAYWKQVGMPKPAATHSPAPAAPSAPAPAQAHTSAAGVVVPLRVGTAAQAASLTDLFKRLAASPALLQAAQSGLLRFDMRVDEAAVKAVAASAGSSGGASAMAATTAIDPAACCSSCKEGKACECKGDTCDMHDHKEDVPELKGVIGEKLLKTLPASVKTVRIHPKAVLTPLGKETLRKRGITIEKGAIA